MNTAELSVSDAMEHSLALNARVLLIDDDPDIHRLVSAVLRPIQATVVSAFDGMSGVQTALDQRPDLVLLDYDLPGANGVDILRALRVDPALSSTPVIVVTGSESRSVLTECFAAGAADYIRKPFVGAELRARVTSVVERQRMLAQLGRAAHLDTLTGLPNRSLLQERLQHSIDRALTDKDYGFAVMFIDFDRFKIINDSLGHDVGDLLLTEIATRLSANLRATDSVALDAAGTTVARLGGDEFVVILDDVQSVEAATVVAERLLQTIERPYVLKAHRVRTSASIGIVHSAGAYREADEMIRDADIAMYEAKARGKACVAQFSTSMRDAVRQRMDTETALREAMGTNQLYLVYQPIVSLEDRRLESVEVLVRWQHPKRGNISPSEFIPIAEETRLILPLADEILRHACRQFVQWQRTAPEHAPEYVSVNLSRVQLADPEIVKRTLSILEEEGMDPRQLQLEVTESQIMQYRVMAAELLAGFKRAGVRLAMDDFGSGYSSLSCLQEFPFDVLKIDRALAENVGRAGGYSALLHAVVTLADNLGLHVVAEGIESLDQLVLLQALGCPAGQGFFLAKPMKADMLESWWTGLPTRRMEAA